MQRANQDLVLTLLNVSVFRASTALLSYGQLFYFTLFLSAQCISSMGRLANQFVSVSQSVTHELHSLQVQIAVKLATKVRVPGDVVIPIVFGGNPKFFYPPNRKWN